MALLELSSGVTASNQLLWSGCAPISPPYNSQLSKHLANLASARKTQLLICEGQLGPREERSQVRMARQKRGECNKGKQKGNNEKAVL